MTAPGPFGVTRTYRKFSELTAEVDNARVWGGIHFRSADVDGSEIGRKIGEIALREFANSPRKTTQLGRAAMITRATLRPASALAPALGNGHSRCKYSPRRLRRI